MKKKKRFWSAVARFSAYVDLGVVEASTMDEAQEKADAIKGHDSLCMNCAAKFDLSSEIEREVREQKS